MTTFTILAAQSVVVTIFSLMSFHSPPPLVESQVQSAAHAIASASTPKELRESYNQLERDLGDIGLRYLSVDPRNQVALAAAWNRLRIAIIDSPESYQIHLNRFLGFAEGRLPTVIPPQWEQSIADAEIHGADLRLSFSRPQINNENLGPTSSAVVHQTEDCWVVSLGNENWHVPTDNLEATLGPANLLAKVGDNHVYAVLYSAQRPHPCYLFIVDKHRNKIIASNEIWAGGGFIQNFAGQGWHSIQIELTKTELIIFGSSIGTVYVESFDPVTATTNWRFGSNYLE